MSVSINGTPPSFRILFRTSSFMPARLVSAISPSNCCNPCSDFSNWTSGRMTSSDLCPGKASFGSFVMPILASAWAAMNFPLSVLLRASEARHFAPPCCITAPLGDTSSVRARNIRAICSCKALLSLEASTSRVEITPISSKVVTRFFTYSSPSNSCSLGTFSPAYRPSSSNSGFFSGLS